jgi:hypothetical protein
LWTPTKVATLPAVSVPQIIAADCEGWDAFSLVGRAGTAVVDFVSGIDIPAIDSPGDMDMVDDGDEWCAFAVAGATCSPLAVPAAHPLKSTAPVTNTPTGHARLFMPCSDPSIACRSCHVSFVTLCGCGLVP